MTATETIDDLITRLAKYVFKRYPEATDLSLSLQILGPPGEVKTLSQGLTRERALLLPSPAPVAEQAPPARPEPAPAETPKPTPFPGRGNSLSSLPTRHYHRLRGTRLTRPDVREIRANGYDIDKVVNKYGCSRSHACRVVNGTTWKGV